MTVLWIDTTLGDRYRENHVPPKPDRLFWFVRALFVLAFFACIGITLAQELSR